ncbi:MAG: hypothetical protein ACI8VT_003748 [Saprospiraceae bacterium]|jgi:hypothetical protein
MIKFFRQIRQNLLIENKISTYLKYAAGEILLVIIGILIAVSINNWNEDRNENRKLKVEEQSLLKDIEKEMELNKKAIEHVIAEHKKSLQAAKELSALFKDREAFNEMSDSTFGQLTAKMYKNHTYDPQSGMLNSIISSGRINQFSNKNLKYLLASFKEATIDAFESTMTIEHEKQDLFKSTLINSYIIKDGNIIGFNLKSPYDDPAFRILNDIFFITIREEGLIEEDQLKEHLELILDFIDQEKD